jgi:TIR domain
MIVSMPYPFVLSYAREDAKTAEGLDPHFKAFLARLNLRVKHLTGVANPGFVDVTSIKPGQEWPNELAKVLQTAETMVCLYSPAYFASPHCGQEMQVFLDRRRKYMDENVGKNPANIIPVLWQPVPFRVPKTLPDIQYKNDELDTLNQGIWRLGEEGKGKEKGRKLLVVADQIAMKVRDAADLTPLAPLEKPPRMGGVLSAFLPRLPLLEFDSPNSKEAKNRKDGPDAITFVYASSTRWDAWPWAPPKEHAVLYLAAAVAQGKDMESTQLVFDLADANLAGRLAALRRKNNLVVLFVDGTSLDIAGLRARLRDYDRPEHSSFATIVMINKNCPEGARTAIDQVFPYFARRAAPHFQIMEAREVFNSELREKFSNMIADVIEQLRLEVMNASDASNMIGNASEFQSLPIVSGPGRVQAVP